MLFCPNCNNILDISKNPPKAHQQTPVDIMTPNTVSHSDADDDKEQNNKSLMGPESIINKIINDEHIDDDIFNTIKMDFIVKSEMYQKLDKKSKSKIQSKISSLLEKMDESTGAYYFCKNCMYSKSIEPGALIVSRVNAGASTDYINYDKLKNRAKSKILPITRNYICINEKCDTNKKGKDRKQKEAVFYRVGNSIQVWYTCKICGSYWKGE